MSELAAKGRHDYRGHWERLTAERDALAAALEAVTQQLTDMHAAIHDQRIESRFIDDSINMLSEGQTSIARARAALASAGVPAREGRGKR